MVHRQTQTQCPGAPTNNMVLAEDGYVYERDELMKMAADYDPDSPSFAAERDYFTGSPGPRERQAHFASEAAALEDFFSGATAAALPEMTPADRTSAVLRERNARAAQEKAQNHQYDLLCTALRRGTVEQDDNMPTEPPRPCRQAEGGRRISPLVPLPAVLPTTPPRNAYIAHKEWGPVVPLSAAEQGPNQHPWCAEAGVRVEMASGLTEEEEATRRWEAGHDEPMEMFR